MLNDVNSFVRSFSEESQPRIDARFPGSWSYRRVPSSRGSGDGEVLVRISRRRTGTMPIASRSPRSARRARQATLSIAQHNARDSEIPQWKREWWDDVRDLGDWRTYEHISPERV